MEIHGKSSSNPITLSDLRGKPSGYYWVEFGVNSPPVKLYFLIEENDRLWMRGQ